MNNAQVRVLMSGGFSAAYQELLPQFENTTNITVTTAVSPSQGDGPNTIGGQLRRGVSADLVILSRDGLAELFAEGRIVIGSDVDLADKGQAPHRYTFTVYALSVEKVDVPPDSSGAMVVSTASEHVLGKAVLVAHYGR